jgi:hypothetical protein
LPSGSGGAFCFAAAKAAPVTRPSRKEYHMPFAHGKNAYLRMEDSTASYVFTADISSISDNWTRDNPQTTTMGKQMHTRIAGLQDYAITVAYVWNSDTVTASAVNTFLDNQFAASGNTCINYAPGGSITGCPLYSACMLISQHDRTAPVNGVVAGTFTLQNSSASVIAGSCA